jgi:hypothetical protein
MFPFKTGFIPGLNVTSTPLFKQGSPVSDKKVTAINRRSDIQMTKLHMLKIHRSKVYNKFKFNTS